MELLSSYGRVLCCALGVFVLAGRASAEPVAYWPFDEAAGTSAADRTGNCDDVRLKGITWCEGRAGSALRFGGEGADTYGTVSDCDALQMPEGFTIQFYWQKTSDDVQILFRKGHSDKQLSFYAYLEGDLHFAVGGADGRVYSATAPRPANGWHHMAFTCDGKALSICVDGAIAGSAPMEAQRLWTSDAPLLIGTHSPGYKYCLAGALDELCISDSALAPAELERELERARALRRAEVTPQVFEPAKGGLVLARDGKPGATIVIGEGAGALQEEPARALQAAIRKITGARLPIRTDADALEGNLVLVGESKLTREPGISAAELTGDVFMMKTAPGRLVLLGHDELLGGDEGAAFSPGRCKSGTSNAVHAFLHDVCGVRWYMPGKLGEVIPRQTSLEVPALDRAEQPARTYALGSFQSADCALWARRNLLGSAIFIKHVGGHLWYSLIPEQQYFADHPEWFALLDGKRTGKGNHLCPTNPELLAEAAKNLKAIYAEGYEWVECGQTDGYQRCRCEACEAADEYRADAGYWVVGTPADRIHSFHAALAQQVQEAYPGRKLLVIAYGPSAEVPHRFDRYPDNVVIEFTHDPPELLARWRTAQDRFTSYVYWFGLYHPMGYGPKSSPGHVASEMRRHRAAGSEAFFFCGGGECWGTEAPSYYVAAEMLRDASKDESMLVREFCSGLFGSAGPTMERYLASFMAAGDEYARFTQAEPVDGQPFVGESRTPAEVLLHCFDAERLEECGRLLGQAAQEAPDDAARTRVSFFRDGFEYVRLTWLCLRAAEEARDETGRAALRRLVGEREDFVRELTGREAARSADLPPVFRGGVEDLLYGPGGMYKEALDKAAAPAGQ